MVHHVLCNSSLRSATQCLLQSLQEVCDFSVDVTPQIFLELGVLIGKMLGPEAACDQHLLELGMRFLV